MPREALALSLGVLLFALFPLRGMGAPSAYQMEILIFAQGEGDGRDIVEPIEGGVPPELLPKSRYRLSGAERVLSRAKGYHPLLHLAWKQPLSQSTRIEGAGIEGVIRLYRAQGLWVDIRLLFEDRYYLKAKRKVRLNEIHYFDHPRFGVLLWVEAL